MMLVNSTCWMTVVVSSELKMRFVVTLPSILAMAVAVSLLSGLGYGLIGFVTDNVTIQCAFGRSRGSFGGCHRNPVTCTL